MDQAVAFMAGVSFLAVGLSYLFRRKDWSEWLHHLRKQGRPAALSVGLMHLVIGTFIVAFHWKWTGLPLLLTVLGVKAILEGYIYTLFPAAVPTLLGWYEPRHRVLLPLAGVITVVIALLVLCEWWQLYQASCFWHPCYNQA